MANRNKQNDLEKRDEQDEEERRRWKKSRIVEDEEEEDEEEEDDEDEEEEDEEDPYWWTPHATMGVLIVIGLLGYLGVLSKFLGPKKAESDGRSDTQIAAVTPANNPASARLPTKRLLPSK